MPSRRTLVRALMGACMMLMQVQTATAASLKTLPERLFGRKFTLFNVQQPQQRTDIQVENAFKSEAGSIVDSVSAINSLIPVPSASASFSYQFDPDLDLFVRQQESLGPIFADRALTLGRGKLIVSTAYSYVSFNTFNGDPLVGGFAADTPLGENFSAPNLKDDVLRIKFDEFSIDVQNIAFFATYGITDRLDVGVGLPLVSVRLEGSATASVVDEQGDSGGGGARDRVQFCDGSFGCSPQGGTVGASRQTVTDSFDESSFGLGDPLLRAKYRFLETAYADAAGLVMMTIPGGGADDLRGYNNVTGTPILVVSKGFGFISPHVNAGYSFRATEDVPQAVWAAGADLRVTPWLTVLPDFLGFLQTAGPRDEIYQFSLGFKANPFRDLILGVNFQLPLNRQGLRADVIYTGTLEYTF